MLGTLSKPSVHAWLDPRLVPPRSPGLLRRLLAKPLGRTGATSGRTSPALRRGRAHLANLAALFATSLAGVSAGRKAYKGAGRSFQRHLRLAALPRPSVTDPLRSIESAKRYFGLGNKVVEQLGPARAEDLERELADNFEFVAPYVGPLPKAALIAATTGLDLGEGLPDFNARYHGFRVDPINPRRVWCQMRVVATHTGVLRFAGITAEPKDPPERTESPPEAVSITFNEAGQVREITTGYPLDRRCGTTGGLGGLFGILEGVGCPLPPFLTRTVGELLPPALRQSGAGEPEEQVTLPVLTSVDALPEDELLKLTEQLIAAQLGVQDPSLLSDSFSFTGPVPGVLRKADFLEAKSSIDLLGAFPDLDHQYRDLRTCPFDVNRVWFTSSPSGTHKAALRVGGQVLAPTGKQWRSPPVCGSMQFDRHGKCIAMTGDYPMDRRMGNTKGLPGLMGLLEALGSPSPWAWTCRTPTQLWSSLIGGSV
mmetsp:Transcript_69975/g.126071  ORF Transcript_69975/g.126071 Transcript_69975/m.126071 type:complete len:482 (-) Transcript_69975:141-1586(-)